jgi:hypothetical protein
MDMQERSLDFSLKIDPLLVGGAQLNTCLFLFRSIFREPHISIVESLSELSDPIIPLAYF